MECGLQMPQPQLAEEDEDVGIGTEPVFQRLGKRGLERGEQGRKQQRPRHAENGSGTLSEQHQRGAPKQLRDAPQLGAGAGGSQWQVSW